MYALNPNQAEMNTSKKQVRRNSRPAAGAEPDILRAILTPFPSVPGNVLELGGRGAHAGGEMAPRLIVRLTKPPAVRIMRWVTEYGGWRVLVEEPVRRASCGRREPGYERRHVGEEGRARRAVRISRRRCQHWRAIRLHGGARDCRKHSVYVCIVVDARSRFKLKSSGSFLDKVQPNTLTN